MDTKAVPPEAQQPVRWKAAQAVAWIVERNEQSVERAANVHLLRELTGLRPTLIGDELPFSLTAAPAELMRAAAAGHIAVIGRLRGTGQAQRVAAHADYTLEDCKEGPCIVSPAYVGDRFWSDLWIRADECRSKWPGRQAVAADPDDGSAQRDQQRSAPSTEGEAIAWMAEEMGRRSRVHEDKGRDAMVLAVTREFPELGTVDAKRLFTTLPKELKTRRGRRPGSRNSGQK